MATQLLSEKFELPGGIGIVKYSELYVRSELLDIADDDNINKIFKTLTSLKIINPKNHDLVDRYIVDIKVKLAASYGSDTLIEEDKFLLYAKQGKLELYIHANAFKNAMGWKDLSGLIGTKKKKRNVEAAPAQPEINNVAAPLVIEDVLHEINEDLNKGKIKDEEEFTTPETDELEKPSEPQAEKNNFIIIKPKNKTTFSVDEESELNNSIELELPEGVAVHRDKNFLVFDNLAATPENLEEIFQLLDRCQIDYKDSYKHISSAFNGKSMDNVQVLRSKKSPDFGLYVTKGSFSLWIKDAVFKTMLGIDNDISVKEFKRYINAEGLKKLEMPYNIKDFLCTYSDLHRTNFNIKLSTLEKQFKLVSQPRHLHINDGKKEYTGPINELPYLISYLVNEKNIEPRRYITLVDYWQNQITDLSPYIIHIPGSKLPQTDSAKPASTIQVLEKEPRTSFSYLQELKTKANQNNTEKLKLSLRTL